MLLAWSIPDSFVRTQYSRLCGTGEATSRCAMLEFRQEACQAGRESCVLFQLCIRARVLASEQKPRVFAHDIVDKISPFDIAGRSRVDVISRVSHST